MLTYSQITEVEAIYLIHCGPEVYFILSNAFLFLLISRANNNIEA